VPFPDHNRPLANTYQSAMGKQAMAWHQLPVAHGHARLRALSTPKVSRLRVRWSICSSRTCSCAIVADFQSTRLPNQALYDDEPVKHRPHLPIVLKSHWVWSAAACSPYYFSPFFSFCSSFPPLNASELGIEVQSSTIRSCGCYSNWPRYRRQQTIGSPCVKLESVRSVH
jgi:hypothetical protein